MTHTAKAYGVIRVTRRRWGPTVNGQYGVDTISLVRVYQNRKSHTMGGIDEEQVEIQLTFPDGYFDHNIPKAEVTFPDLPPMQVRAEGVNLSRQQQGDEPEASSP